MRTVIGIGHPAAGDDAVALSVVDLLVGCPGLVLRKCMDPTNLVMELQDASDVILVDALVGAGEPGQVAWLTVEDLHQEGVAHSHGMSVARALDLASRLMAELPDIRILGVCVEAPRGFNMCLSPAAEAGAARAAAMIRELATCTNPL